MKNSPNGDSLFETIISHMPSDVVATLTTSQLAAFRSSCYQFRWRKHPVDLRVSIPFPGKAIYFVFLAGPERRSPQRLRTENPRYLYKAIIAFSLLVGAVAGGSVVVWQSLQPAIISLQRSSVYPVSIPWLHSEGDCEKTGRTWSNGNCWDSEHSPDF
jgi:hypothetical protein